MYQFQSLYFCGVRRIKLYRTAWHVLTDNDLTGLGGFGDLIGTAHL